MNVFLHSKQEKDKEKSREKDREAKEKEKKAVNGHLFSSVSLSGAAFCQHCNKTLNAKDAVSCAGKRMPLSTVAVKFFLLPILCFQFHYCTHALTFQLCTNEISGDI